MSSVRRRLFVVVALVAGVATVSATAGAAPASGGSGRPTMSIGDATAYEGDGTISFPVTLDRPAERGGAFALGVTLPGSARANRDYEPQIVFVAFPRGATKSTIDVPLIDDDVEEGDEKFSVALLLAFGARLGDRTGTATIVDDDGPLTVNVLHVNDHHSHLQPDAAPLNLGTAGGPFNTTFGGFPRVTAKIAELDSQLDNVVKIHAGDAITGTLFYTLFQGQADADLMNTVCFDIFELGNHEFDDSDAVLASFLDALNADPDCDTATLAANVVPEVGTPLAPTGPNDYLLPYVVKELDGQQVGFIGIDIAGKTRDSSQPLDSTVFLDEVETTQFYVDELAAQGIDNIVLVTHYGYENDLALASAVTGVDAIVGGDSHSLLGDYARYGLAPAGPYPTNTTNASGEPVCVVQAWQYSWVVGELSLTFDDGAIESCAGTPHLLVGDTFTRGTPAQPVPPAEADEIRAAIAAAPDLVQIAPDPAAQDVLTAYAAQVDVLGQQVIGTNAEVLCDRRVPNVPRGSCPPGTVASTGASLAVNGGFIQQVVTDAFLARAFRSDIAIQNGGGVRVDLNAGPITIAEAYTILPFSNTLVELELSGAEVKQSLEDAGNFYLANPGAATGAYPYGSAIRWDTNLSAPSGNRFQNVEVRADDGTWGPLDPAATYTVVTNSFLAGGGDGYLTFKAAADDGRVTDTFINYAQGLIDYIEQDLGGGTLTVPTPDNFSTQSFVPAGGP